MVDEKKLVFTKMNNLIIQKITRFAFLILVSLLIPLLLFSCNPQEVHQATATNTDAIVQSSETPPTFSTHISSATPTMASTVDLIKEETLIPTETYFPTVASTLELNVSISEFSISPDMQWIAVLLFASTNHKTNMHMSLKVVHTAGNPSWTAEEFDPPNSGLYNVPIPFEWSKDGRFFYFSHRLNFGDGCIGNSWAMKGTDLYKLDLNSGEIIQVAPHVGHWLALSPDETRLAYLSENELGILDLINEEQITYTIPQTIALNNPYWVTDLIWSPNNHEAILVIWENICSDQALYTIVLVNIETTEFRSLVEHSEIRFKPVDWPVETEVILEGIDHKKWILDPVTKSLTEES